MKPSCQGWKQSKLGLILNQGPIAANHGPITNNSVRSDCGWLFRYGRHLGDPVLVLKGTETMTKVMYLLPITSNGQMLEPANYDWQDNLPKALNAAQLKAESDYVTATHDLQYRSLKAVMDTSAKEIAILAKLHRADLSAAVRDAIETANRPDTIPSDLSIIRDGTILGMADAMAWRKGQHSVASHMPQPLPAYNAPQRSKTASELQVEAWLSQDRSVKPLKASGKGVRRAAKFWDHGDGHKWTQPVDARNSELRSQRLQAAQ